jgi:hypothetical protein
MAMEELAMAETTVEIDIPCDPQSMDETGMPWAFLDEARDPSRITVGAIVVTADEQDPVLARVHSLTDRSMGTVVHLELLPGDPLDYADALQRAHLFAG